MEPRRPPVPILIMLIVMGISILLMVVSMVPLTSWASFDRTRSIGPVNYHLEADFDAVGFRYTMETVEGNGSSGGIIGGGGLGADFNISREKTYPQVRGEFLENIGIIYNSYDNKAFQYELKMRSPPTDSDIVWNEVGNPSALLNVTLGSDLIPWWPESGERTLEVKIELMNLDLWDQVGDEERNTINVQVNKVTIWAKTGYDQETGEYTGEDKMLAKRDLNIDLSHLGDSKTLSFSVGYPSGTDAAGFYAQIEGNMTDYWGRPELSPLSGKPNPINVYPMSTDKVALGIGIPMAMPLMIISSILALTTVVLWFIKGKVSLGFIIPASILSIIAPLWFFMGMNAAVELLGERLTGAEEGLSWAPGIFISFAGAIFMMAALGLAIFSRIKNKKDESSKEGQGTPKDEARPVFKKLDDGPGAPGEGPVFKKI